MMDPSSYYDVALNDLEYLKFTISNIDKAPNFNMFLIQEEQICEKFLKHLVQKFVFDKNVKKILTSHKLITLVNAIRASCDYDLKLDNNKLRVLSEYYYDGRYPSIDYLIGTKEEALGYYRFTLEVLEVTRNMLGQYEIETAKMEFFTD